MKVSLGTVELDARDRFTIAKYFGKGSRCTRKQARAFALGALRTAVREHGEALNGRSRAAFKRLSDGRPLRSAYSELTPPTEKQLSLLTGEK